MPERVVLGPLRRSNHLNLKQLKGWVKSAKINRTISLLFTNI